jgi:hypothetical protein
MRHEKWRWAALALACGTITACQEAPTSDLEVAIADLHAKPALLLKAGSETQKKLGVSTWEVNTSKKERLIFGLDGNGKRVFSIRTKDGVHGTTAGRVTWAHGKPALFVYDAPHRKLRTADRRFQAMLEGAFLYEKDFHAHNVLRSFADAACVACAIGVVACVGNAGGCIVASAATEGMAALFCGMRTVGSCAGMGVACGMCSVDDSPPPPPPDDPADDPDDSINVIIVGDDDGVCEEEPAPVCEFPPINGT